MDENSNKLNTQLLCVATETQSCIARDRKRYTRRSLSHPHGFPSTAARSANSRPSLNLEMTVARLADDLRPSLRTVVQLQSPFRRHGRHGAHQKTLGHRKESDFCFFRQSPRTNRRPGAVVLVADDARNKETHTHTPSLDSSPSLSLRRASH